MMNHELRIMSPIYIIFTLLVLGIIELSRSRQRYRLIRKIIADIEDVYPDVEKIVFSSLSYRDNFFYAAVKLLQLLENGVYSNNTKVKKKIEELKRFVEIDKLFYKILASVVFILVLFYLIMIGFNKRFL
mgnify:CR=1 FL=1